MTKRGTTYKRKVSAPPLGPESHKEIHFHGVLKSRPDNRPKGVLEQSGMVFLNFCEQLLHSKYIHWTAWLYTCVEICTTEKINSIQKIERRVEVMLELLELLEL
jgi:hypothetical protein